MIGTLIGAFITASGILLSADTSVSDPTTGKTLTVQRKLEVTGRLSGAAINGQFQWSGDVSANFLRVFREVSKNLRTSTRVSVREQAARFAVALKAEAEGKARPGIHRYLPNGELLTVTIAGFDDGQPNVVSFNIVLDISRSSNTAVRFAVVDERIYPPACWWLGGKNAVALGLIRDDTQLPPDIRQDPAVLAVRTLEAGHCDTLTDAQARAFFRVAVDATVAHGPRFGIRNGEVGTGIDVLSITPFGAAIERLR